MKQRRFPITALLCAGLALGWLGYSSTRGEAEEKARFVGTDTCLKCHSKVAKNWAMTVHRRTLFNTDPSKKGCEGCHGPGGAHVDGAGDPALIVRPERLKPAESAAICTGCHTQEHVTLWRTSSHARSKLTCIDCHDSHNPDPQTLSLDIDNAKLQLDGLTRSLHSAELTYGQATDKTVQAEAYTKLVELKEQREKLLKDLKGTETIFQRTAEPYVCYNCHKAQKAQGNLPSRHPIREGRMKCSDCHNPHGGPSGSLREESVNETCYKCHAEKAGPFVYDHPPVTEDCTVCHNPHGTVNNNLLKQPEPFVCLKCHPGPHSNSKRLDPATGTFTLFSDRYGKCMSCHAEVHGSDTHRRFMN